MTTDIAKMRSLNGPIHTSFGLSYANYLVLPRTLLQSMPEEWQAKFVALVNELYSAFRHVEQAQCYDVTPGVEREIGELTEAERAKLGITVIQEPDLDDEDDDRPALYSYRGEEYEGWERVIWPTEDPVPHYNRGRTYVEPRIGGAE